MDKQEYIKRLSYARYSDTDDERYNCYNKGIDIAISFAKQLDEPKKPIVPQYIADWYEENKDDFEFNLHYLCIEFYDRPNELDNKIKNWVNTISNKAIQTIVNMHQFGYEVEKEKLYTVEIPSPNEPDSGHIVLQKNNHNKVYIDLHYVDNWRKLRGVQLTESEIKKDFEWAWQFAKEVEE